MESADVDVLIVRRLTLFAHFSIRATCHLATHRHRCDSMLHLSRQLMGGFSAATGTLATSLATERGKVSAEIALLRERFASSDGLVASLTGRLEAAIDAVDQANKYANWPMTLLLPACFPSAGRQRIAPRTSEEIWRRLHAWTCLRGICTEARTFRCCLCASCRMQR